MCWECNERLDVVESGVASLPEDVNFLMILPQNHCYAYVSDLIAQDVVLVNLVVSG
jgi:hypothetical protein